jgi:hypothetical protein
MLPFIYKKKHEDQEIKQTTELKKIAGEQENKRQVNKITGYQEKRTREQENKRTREQENKRTREQENKRTREQENKRTKLKNNKRTAK